MNYPVDLEMVTDASWWWKCERFLPAKVPMLVDPEIMAWTCPPGVIDRRLTHSDGRQYVASAEQSFLQLEKDGLLKPGDKRQALTPCYRDEDNLDETHLNVFLKLELIEYHSVEGSRGICLDHLAECLAHRMRQFFEYRGLPVEVAETEIGYDVMYEDLELGSFGVRISPLGNLYIYGTGLAEPRASIAMQRHLHKISN